MIKLIVALIHPRLESAAVLWSPQTGRQTSLRESKEQQPRWSQACQIYHTRNDMKSWGSLKERREKGSMIVLFRAVMGVDGAPREALLLWNGMQQEYIEKSGVCVCMSKSTVFNRDDQH